MSGQWGGRILLRTKRGKLPQVAHIFEPQPEGVALTTYEGDSEVGAEYLLPRDVARSYYRWLTRNGFRLVSQWRGFGLMEESVEKTTDKTPDRTADKTADKVVEIVQTKAVKK